MSEENMSVENTDSSTESVQQEVAPQADTGASADQVAQHPKTAEESTPFHMHPRFQEVITQKNELAQRLDEMQKAYQQKMQSYEMQMQEIMQRVPKTQPVNPMYEKLKGIDPEFADYLKGLEDKTAKYESLEQKLSKYDEYIQAQETATLRAGYENKMQDLYTQHKVPEAYKPFVQSQIENMVYNNPKAGLKDVDAFFKQAYDNVNKTFEDFKRSQMQAYVTDKKKDAVPATQTGGQTVKNSPQAKPMSKHEIAAMMAKEMRAAKQTI